MGCCAANSNIAPTQWKRGSRRETSYDASNFVTLNNAVITDNYTFGKELGAGTFGHWVLANMRDTGLTRWVKIIDKRKANFESKDRENFYNEVQLLKSMDHPNIMKIFEFYEDRTHYFLVTEYCKGGELFDFLVDKNHLNERVVQRIIFQIVAAIRYWHDHQIVHRDLKPENILLDQNPQSLDDINIKIIDFGTSSFAKHGQKLHQQIGTAYYVAPEVIKGNYNELWDLWSIGVITFLLISGQPPFKGRNTQEILQKVVEGKYEFKSRIWEQISEDCKYIIMQFLQPQKQRISAKDALKEHWLQENKQQDSQLKHLETIMTKLTKFRADRKLQRAVLTFISSQLLSDAEIQQIRNDFNALDTNNDGRLDRDELMNAYTKVKGVARANKQTVDAIFDQIDADGSGYIEYGEFLVAEMDKKKDLNKTNLVLAFQKFDQDGDGHITEEEVKSLLGDQIDDQIWDSILRDIDKSGTGAIELKEFTRMMLEHF